MNADHQPEAVRDRQDVSYSRIYWATESEVILDYPGECLRFRFQKNSREVQKTIEDLNQRCLKLMDHRPTTAEFGKRLRAVAEQLRVLLNDCGDLVSHFETPHRDIVFVSDSVGLELPIELLPVHKSYLALESRISRRVHGVHPPHDRRPFGSRLRDLIAQGGTLKVLLVGSDPRNVLKNLEAELKELEEHIELSCDRLGLKARITVLGPLNATRSQLNSVLKDKNYGPFHLFHFCGHGEHGQNPDESSVIVAGKHGEDEPISCEGLRLLLQDRVLWLAYLSCCYGAASHGSDATLDQQYVGTLDAILSARIPDAVGFRWAVTDSGAYALALRFYDQLLALDGGFDPSFAMWQARRSLAGDEDKKDAWASSIVVSQCG
jgi:hypothetical protein